MYAVEAFRARSLCVLATCDARKQYASANRNVRRFRRSWVARNVLGNVRQGLRKQSCLSKCVPTINLPRDRPTNWSVRGVQSMFKQGNVVLLQSVNSGQGLCVHKRSVSGKGIRDLHCKKL